MTSGDFTRALAAFRQAAAADPQSVPALNGLAECAFALNDLDAADKYTLQALRLEPNSLETLNNAGVILYQRGEYSKAEQALIRALAQQPGNSDSHLNLLHVYGRLGSKSKLDGSRTARLLDAVRHLTAQPVSDERRSLLSENHRLRDDVLARFDGSYATQEVRILLHRPANGAIKYLMDSWAEVLNHMGIPTSVLNWGVSTREAFMTFLPTVFITVGDQSYSDQLDNDFIARYREEHRLTIGRIFGGARIEPTDFVVTFHLDPASDPRLSAIDKPLVSLPFGINPRRHCMRPGHDVWDYFFVGSNSHLKAETTGKYLTPIINNYAGLLAGTGWPVGIGELSVSQAALCYNLAQIYPNFHLPWQYDQVDEINERAYIIPACGGFELVDNPAAMRLLFKHDEMAVAHSVSEYHEMFAHFLAHPEERAAYVLKGMHKVYDRYTLFHVLTKLADFLGVSPKTEAERSMPAPAVSSADDPLPSISALIPTFNRSQLLKRTLTMLVEQDYPRLEVVVVDDCSTDDTPEVIASFKDKLPGLVTHRNELNLGAITSFCKSAELATGEYILMFADDDLLAPGALREYVKPLATQRCDIVYSDLQVIDQHDQPGAVWRYRAYSDKWELMRHLMEAGANVIPEAHLIKRDVYDKYYSAWYQKRCVGPIFVPAIDSLTLAYVPKPLYLYRIHSDSTFKDVTGLLSRNKGVTNYMNMIMFRHSPVQLFRTGRGREQRTEIGEAILNFVRLLLAHGGKFVQGTFYTGRTYAKSDLLFAMYYEYAWHWLETAKFYLDEQITVNHLQENIVREVGPAYDIAATNRIPSVFRELPWFAYKPPHSVCDFVPFDMITVGDGDLLSEDEYIVLKEGTVDMRIQNRRVRSAELMAELLSDHVYQVVNVFDERQLEPVLRILEQKELYFATVVDFTGQPHVTSSLLANRIQAEADALEGFEDYLALVRSGSGQSPWYVGETLRETTTAELA